MKLEKHLKILRAKMLELTQPPIFTYQGTEPGLPKGSAFVQKDSSLKQNLCQVQKDVAIPPTPEGCGLLASSAKLAYPPSLDK